MTTDDSAIAPLAEKVEESPDDLSDIPSLYAIEQDPAAVRTALEEAAKLLKVGLAEPIFKPYADVLRDMFFTEYTVSAPDRDDLQPVRMVRLMERHELRDFVIYARSFGEPAKDADRMTQYLRNWTVETAVNATEILADQLAENANNSSIDGLATSGRTLLESFGDVAERAKQLTLIDGSDVLVHRAAHFVSEAQGAAKKAQDAAGMAGTASLGAYFADFATTERTSTTRWTITAAAALALLVVYSAALVNRHFTTDYEFTWQDAALHAWVAVPLLALAGYAARIASHHREARMWAQTVSEQLKTVGAYVEGLLDDESRSKVMLALADRVFATPDYGSGTRTDKVNVSADELVELVRKLLEATRRNQ
ncbi:hypothetical protein [Hoyosella subflava]|uniref:Hypothetical membrane protein n=1 Tax=Hoyosella subflava (strain DSM 45089 / JCM 17490 / NBRC 109087 / DQS3-9A1) TaxID=443218 RepID=F6ELJ8_HOYSD|nr:hypothetical protein [Hoyosella subflava]AEF40248.1 Hypothetical membrane protein [Hoyosella subflava DQS3-9A1]